MSVQWSTTGKISRENPIKVLIHSPAGYGKTVLGASMPRPMMIGVEKGELSLTPENIARCFGSSMSDISYDFPLAKIENLKDLEEVTNFCLSSKGAGNFDSFNLDSISDIAEVILANYLRTTKDPRMAYGDMQQQITRFMRVFRDLPNHHVYFSAKQELVIDENNKQLRIPSMPGKTLTKDIPYFFDEVFALDIEDSFENGRKIKKRVLTCHPSLQLYAKDRSGTLAEKEPAHLGYIINKIQNG